jgi:DNA polymerase-3 subunit delta'
LNTEDALRLAYLSDGSYNRALQLLKEEENDYTSDFILWLRYCWKPDMENLIPMVEKIAGTGRENQKNFLLYGLHLFRECLLKNQQLDELNKLLNSEKEFVQNFSKLVKPDNIGALSEAFSRSHYLVERNANPKILFYNLSLQINDLLRKN